MYWNDLNSRLKAEYGCKVYKLALSSGGEALGEQNVRYIIDMVRTGKE